VGAEITDDFFMERMRQNIFTVRDAMAGDNLPLLHEISKQLMKI